MQKNNTIFAIRFVLIISLLLVAGATGAAEPSAPPVAGPPYPIEAYLQIRQATDAHFTADGETAVFLTDISGSKQVWKTALAGGEPVQLTTFDDPVDYVVPSPTDPRLLLFGKARQGDERRQLYLMDIDGTKIERLTEPESAIFDFGAWSRDGKTIAYSSNHRDPAVFDVYLLELADRQSRLVMQGDAYLRPVAFSPSGRRLIVSRREANFDNNLYLLDLKKPKEEPVLLTPHARWAVYDKVSWPVGPKSAKGFYLVSNLQNQFAKPAWFNIQKQQLEYLDQGLWDTEQFHFSRNGLTYAYGINYQGYSKLALFDVKEGKQHPALQLPPGVIQDLELSPKGDRLLLSISNAAAPREIYLADVKTGETRRLTHSGDGGVPAESFVEPELIAYPARDKMMIPALLYLPKTLPEGEKAPCLVYLHGGPEGQSRPDFSPLFQYFLNHGYAVLLPNIRGSNGYGKSFLYSDDKEKRPDSVRDVAAAVEHLRRNVPQIDPERIAVFGISYGGYLVLAALTEFPDLFAAGVCGAGISDFETYLENTGPWRRKIREAEYGSLATDRELLKQLSPIHRLDRLQAPLLVIHGRNDPRVPLSEAEQVARKLQESGRPVTLLVYDDEGHWLRQLKNQMDAYPKIVAFLDMHLKKRQTEQP